MSQLLLGHRWKVGELVSDLHWKWNAWIGWLYLGVRRHASRNLMHFLISRTGCFTPAGGGGKAPYSSSSIILRRIWISSFSRAISSRRS